jgi:hypothetical protein
MITAAYHDDSGVLFIQNIYRPPNTCGFRFYKHRSVFYIFIVVNISGVLLIWRQINEGEMHLIRNIVSKVQYATTVLTWEVTEHHKTISKNVIKSIVT